MAAFVMFTCLVQAAPAGLDGFGVAGKVITPIVAGNAGDFARSIALQPDGKLVVAGACELNRILAFCVARYQANGLLDETFGDTTGEAGKVITTVINGATQTQSVVVQRDGRIVVAAGCGNNDTPLLFCVIRYTSLGAIDTSFNGSGMVFTDVAGAGINVGASVALQSDGKIVVAGRCRASVEGRIKFCIARYDGTGALDNSFNGNGKLVTSIIDGGDDFGTSMVVQPDGQIVVAGFCTDPGSGHPAFCLVRYNATDGSPDLGFNSNGSVVTSINAGANAASVALQSDGKILVGGRCFNGIRLEFCLARYRPEGVLDSTFNSTGIAITAIASGVANIGTGVAVQPDGQIVMVGQCFDTVRKFCLARYRSNGALDVSFNGTGKLISSQEGFAQSVAIQPNGKIVVAGHCTGDITNEDFCLARFEGGPLARPICSFDIDGDGQVLATTDMLIAMRAALGMTGTAVLDGINFPQGATRTTWGDGSASDIRRHLIAQCGMNIAQ
jgi:uncharacterized delta-60 repeat protein